MSLHDLQDHVRQDLPTDEFESLGGLLMEVLGHVPAEGETAQYGGLALTVQSMNGQRMEWIRVEATPGQQRGVDEAHPGDRVGG
jgi:CBS domain containing-hemolysin-like protein